MLVFFNGGNFVYLFMVIYCRFMKVLFMLGVNKVKIKYVVVVFRIVYDGIIGKENY